MRIVRKRKRHEFEADGATFYSDRNFAGVGVGGDVAAACASGRDKNWCLELLRAVVTGWDGVMDEDGEPVAFRPALLDAVPPAPASEIASQIIALYEKEADQTAKELGESEAGVGSSDAAAASKG